ncbi:hypothetical protein J6590_017710 [Homalodisca vitripennis]|nr:hypothetical protein J6590_017710 [Homalodisca vitripennis]
MYYFSHPAEEGIPIVCLEMIDSSFRYFYGIYFRFRSLSPDFSVPQCRRRSRQQTGNRQDPLGDPQLYDRAWCPVSEMPGLDRSGRDRGTALPSSEADGHHAKLEAISRKIADNREALSESRLPRHGAPWSSRIMVCLVVKISATTMVG